MAFFRRNDKVEYESTRTAGRKFSGVVQSVNGDKALVKHETEPKFVTVAVQRLQIKPRNYPTVHKGRTA